MRKNLFFCLCLLFTMYCYGQQSDPILLEYDTSGYGSGSGIANRTIPPSASAMDTIPSIKSQMNVNDAGALTIMVPIEVLKGVNGHQPNIALGYNSQNGNGQAGFGWNIMGLSMLTRGGKSQYLDGITAGAQFDNTDPYYLDGQRLLTIDGINFETEKYSKIKIKKISNDIYSFIVKYTDGKIAKYKELTPGQNYISVMIDQFDNEIHYQYQIINNIPIINTISYGGNDIANDKFIIKFNYADRAINSKVYRNGTEYNNTKILKEIIVSSSYLNSNGGLHRKYTLFHDLINSATVERLYKIELENETGFKLKPLQFTYNTSTSAIVESTTDYNVGLQPYAVGLGSVAIGDFYNLGKPVAVFEVKQENGSYTLFSSFNYSIANYPDPKKYFCGKTLINGRISDNDQLISLTIHHEDTPSQYYIEDQGQNFVSESITFLSKNLLTGQNSVMNTAISVPATLVYSDYTQPTAIANQSQYITGDFNNDGLIDVLFYNGQSVSLVEVGKSTPNNVLITYFQGQPINGDNVYQIEFDGDGIPELLGVDSHTGIYSVYKLNFSNHTIAALPLEHGNTLSNFSSKTPLIFGDFNGDGLTDFITPTRVFSLENSTALEQAISMELEPLTWWQYISNGTSYIKTLKNYTQQKLAYMAPTQRDQINHSSDWEKFWSGRPDTYDFTEYGASNIIATDFNNDGKTDLICFNKYGKAKFAQNGHLINTALANLDIGLPQANKIRFFETKTNADGSNALVNLPTEIPLQNTVISPVSLILNITDFNKLESYKAGITIYDPLRAHDLNFIVNNENFNEGEIRTIDNGTPIIQKVEYRPMVEKNNNNKETFYTVDITSNFTYPLYVHKNIGINYLVNKIHSLFDNKILTTEYRYENAIQDLSGKGFIGFQKTAVSDPYESLFINGKYQVKNLYKGIFWTVKGFDPLLENAPKFMSYGSLNPSSLFSLTNYTNQRFDKGNHRYLILSTYERTTDFLKGTVANKAFQYDSSADLLLQQVNTDFNGQSASTTIFTYAPEFSNSNHYFFGKITRNENQSVRDGATFTTKEEQDFNPNGSIDKIRKIGNSTPAIETTYTYYPYGEIQTETLNTQGMPIPLTTSYQYDSTNRYIWKVTTPDGKVATTNIRPNGRMTDEVSTLGLITSYKFDRWGNVKETTDHLGIKTTIKKIVNTSDPAGAYSISKKTDGGIETIATFDKFDRQVRAKTQTLNSQWIIVKTEYDIFGNKTDVSEPYYQGETPLWNKTEYDPLNRPIKFTSFTGKVVTTCYEGLKVTVDDGVKQVAKWFDATGNVIGSADAGGEIFYSYYPNGSIKETDYAGIKTKITIDGWGNKIKLEDPSAGNYLYEYDNLSRIKKETNPKGGITQYAYDNFGKPLSENTNSPSENTTIVKNFGYDPNSNLPTTISGTYNGKSYSYTTFYDTDFRVKGKEEMTPDFTYRTETSFDNYGRADITELKVILNNPSHTSVSHIKNVYDNNGIIKQQIDNDAGGSIWEVNSINSHRQITQMAYGNGYTVNSTYNNATLALEKIKHDNGANTVIDINYEYDALRGILLRRNNLIFGKDEHYDYDDLDRLLEESVNSNTVQTYTYDKRGRMTSNTDVGKYSFNEQDYKLQNINFNVNGVALNNTRGFAEIQYNAFKSPNEIVLTGKDRISYDYSILKTRSASYYGSLDVSAVARPNRKFYSSDKTIEITKEGNITKIVTYLTGDPYSANYIKMDVLTGSALTSSNHYYLHRDNQGTILAVTSAAANGAVVEKRYFDAWGNLKNAQVAGVDYLPNAMGWVSQLILDRGYTGHEHLKTVGLIHMNGRIYDPVLKRFMSPDNFVQDIYNTQNYNRYGYVWNNPLLYTDSTGESGEVVALVVAVVVAVVINGISNSAHHTPFWYGAGKAGVIGGVTAVISFGIGSIATDLFGTYLTVGKALFEAGMHAMVGGIMGAIENDNFGSGFAAGAVSSLVASGIEGIGETGGYYTNEDYTNWSDFGSRNPELIKAAMVASGGLSGGISSSITGGDFWAGARQGLITSGLNHAAHLVEHTIEDETKLTRVTKALKGTPKPGNESMGTLLKNSEMNEEYVTGGSPKLGTQLAYDEAGNGSYRGETDPATKNIKIYPNAYTSWRTLASTMVHEFTHRFHMVNGLYYNWMNKYGTQGAKDMSDVFAYQREQFWGYDVHFFEEQQRIEKIAGHKFQFIFRD